MKIRIKPYLQLEHALKAQFRNYSLVWNETPLLHSILQAAPTKGLISKIYNQLSKEANSEDLFNDVKVRWEEDVGVITQAQWKRWDR